MAFRFRLQKVLDHRRRVESEAKRSFIAAQQATVQALKDLESLYLAIDHARSQGHQAVRGESSPSTTPMLQHIDHFIQGQKIRIERQRSKIRDIKSEEERLQDVLIAAARERKTLEKLYERHLQEYREFQNRLEQAEADDLTTLRFGRGEGP